MKSIKNDWATHRDIATAVYVMINWCLTHISHSHTNTCDSERKKVLEVELSGTTISKEVALTVEKCFEYCYSKIECNRFRLVVAVKTKKARLLLQFINYIEGEKNVHQFINWRVRIFPTCSNFCWRKNMH